MKSEDLCLHVMKSEDLCFITGDPACGDLADANIITGIFMGLFTQIQVSFDTHKRSNYRSLHGDPADTGKRSMTRDVKRERDTHTYTHTQTRTQSLSLSHTHTPEYQALIDLYM